MVHNAGARQVFRKYGHAYIFFKRGTTHNPAVFEKTGHLVWIFYGHNANFKMAQFERKIISFEVTVAESFTQNKHNKLSRTL